MQPEQREIIEWDEYTGRLAAIDSVEMRARVSGYLDSIHFKDGDLVEQGQLLFVIDPRPFEAELREARADLSARNAAVELAESNFERGRRLVEQNALPREQFEIRRNEAREAEVAVEAAEARVEAAELQVEFTRIRAPISGRISDYFVSRGNYVSGGSAQGTLLTTIVSIDPIYCEFEVSERDFLKYARLARSGQRVSSRDRPNVVYLQLADEDGFPHEGQMHFVDNRLDAASATMRGQAIFDNPEGYLTPGLFGRVRLQGSERYEAILIPDRAIGTDQSERFVMTIGADGTAQRTTVELGPLVDGLRVVRSGLAPDDRLIAEGLMRVLPGAPVAPTEVTIAELLSDGATGAPAGEAPPANADDDSAEGDAAS